MKTKNSILYFGVAVALSSSLMTNYQSVADEKRSKNYKIASVSMDTLTQCWPAVGEAVSELEAYYGLIKKSLSDDELKLQKKGDELQKQKNILTNEAFQKEVQKYKSQFDGFNQKREQYSILLDKCKAAVMENFQSSMASFTSETAASLKMDLVLPSSVIIFNSGSIHNISENVCGTIKKKAKQKIDVRPVCSEIIKSLNMEQLYFPSDKEVKKYQSQNKK